MPKTVVVEELGLAKTTQKIVPGNTATGIGAGIYQYIERTMDFTSGGTTEIVAGDYIVGATSSATAKVISIGTITGTWGAGSAAGTLTIAGQVGDFQAAEKIKVAGGSDDATVTANSSVSAGDFPYKGNAMAKAAMITCRANNALFTIDGTKPDQTSLIGHTLAVNGSLTLVGFNNIANFKVIDYASSSASTISVTCFF